jgi:hypothetical protein
MENLPVKASETEIIPLDADSQGVNFRSSWNMSLDQIRPAIAHYAVEAKETLVAAFRWCIDPRHPVPKPDFARRVGASDNLIYKIYTGNYRHPETKAIIQPSTDLLRKIREFLNLEKERYEAGDNQFVATPTAKKIALVCELARESGTVAFLESPSHIGKSWALEHHTSANNHGRTIYVRMGAASGLGGMIRRIANAIGISAASNSADLIQRIKKGLTKDTLLILDEVHLLAHTYRKGSFHNCMEVIREIHDETGCGMVLAFTILDAVKAASQKELQQLWRRGVHKCFLPSMPTIADLTAILKHNGLEFPDPGMVVTVPDDKGKPITDKPRDLLRQVAKDEALLAVCERLRYGRKLANKAGEKMAWKHFVRAHLLITKNAEREDDWI